VGKRGTCKEVRERGVRRWWWEGRGGGEVRWGRLRTNTLSRMEAHYLSSLVPRPLHPFSSDGMGVAWARRCTLMTTYSGPCVKYLFSSTCSYSSCGELLLFWRCCRRSFANVVMVTARDSGTQERENMVASCSVRRTRN